jgi:hypothetical protein
MRCPATEPGAEQRALACQQPVFEECFSMRYTTNPDHPFDTDNRAWRRFVDLLGEHFDVVDWTTQDGRPVLTTLVDLDSGDTFTVAIMDSIEVREPHALLAFTTGGDLAAHGPFNGEPAAGSYAPDLAMTDATIAATRPVPLHHPDQQTLPDDAWLTVPAALAQAARSTLVDTRAAALVLLDRTHGRLTAVGPFRNHASAAAWRAAPDLEPTIDRLIVALHTAPVEPHGT